MGIPHNVTWGPSFSHKWGATAILPGKFGGNVVAPIDGAASDYPYRWVTVGGEGTSSSNWQETAEKDIISSNALGMAFDEEGGVLTSDARAWILKMRKVHPTWTFVYVPACGATMEKYDPAAGSCDFIAPMMYYSNDDSYPRMDLTLGEGNVAGCIARVQEAGWPNARTILTYQSFDAYRTSGHPDGAGGGTGPGNGRCYGCAKGPGNFEGTNLMATLGKLLGNYSVTVNYWNTNNVTMQGPYAGVLGWPSQCGGGMHRCWPEMDQRNTQIVLDNYKRT
jgi:hypothetical protein